MISFGKRSKQTVGLDIGSGSIKVAVVDHSGAEPELVHVAYLPLVTDAIVDGEIIDPVQVVDTVKAVLESSGVVASRVVTAVGGRDVIVKKIQMDRMRHEDAREVIRWEAEQFVPFDMANVELDFQILDPEGEDLQMSVLLVAAKRDLVEQKVMLLEDAGLSATIIDLEAFALHNAFEYNYPEAARGLVALVNVGNDMTTVIAQQAGIPVVSADLPFGLRRLREDLRRLHGFDAERADQALQGRSGDARTIAPLLADRFRELAQGVERSLSFLADDAGFASGIAAVYLAGGGAHAPGLAEALGERLRTRIEVANPLQRLKVRPSAAVHFPVDEVASMLMLPVGLALRTAA